MGFSGQEYWNGLPFPSPGDLPSPGIEPRSPALQVDSLPAEPAVGSITKVHPFPCPLGAGFPLEEPPPGGLFFLTELLISRAEGVMYLVGKLGERTGQTNPVSSWVPFISELVVQVFLLPS